MFSIEQINGLFSDLSRWGMAVTHSKSNYKDLIVIRRHYWDDNDPEWRFTIDRNTDTVYEMRLGKERAKQSLIKFLQNIELMEKER